MADLFRSSGRRSFYTSKRRPPMSNINVTPFVDVMLVLLIIFMVTAPLLTVGVQVDLPKTKAKAISGSDEPLAVTIDRNGLIYVQNTQMELDQVAPRLKAISAHNPNVRVFVRGDAQVGYGRVLEVMGVLSAAGFSRVALIAKNSVVKPKSKKNK